MPSATRSKHLRTGRSVWMRYPVRDLPTTPLPQESSIDVVVIGAGITGAMMAEELTEAGFSVAILDRRGALQGATAASTALVQYELDVPLTLLTAKIGSEKAMRAWRRAKLAVDSISGKIRELDIACNAMRRDSLYLSGNLLDVDALYEEYDARARIGLRSQFLDRATLLERYGIPHDSALLSHDNMSVNPRRLAAGLLRCAIERGAKLHSPVEVASVEPYREGADVITTGGARIHARHVIFTTGYEIPRYIQSRRFHIVSTWAMATPPQPRKLWPDEVFLWEAAHPYIYVRTTIDGRVICGGEDEEFSDAERRDALIPEKTRILQEKLHRLFPQLDTTAEFAWAGCFGSTTTGLPSIGKIPDMPNTYAVLAFGGNGMTFSRIGAEILRSELTGKHDPDADLFAFGHR